MDIKKEVKKVIEQMVIKYKPEKIIIFGSYVKGDFSKDSDLDFLIIKNDVPKYGVDRIRELSKLIDRKIPCDFFICKQEELEKRLKLGDPFIKKILKEGEVVYDK